jgi:CO/xanthine dehydrogenase Mo-binding subunit
MPITSKVSGIDLERMTPEERQQAELHGFADLARAMQSPPAAPPAAPAPRPAPAANYAYVGKEQRDLEGYKIVTGKARYTADVFFPDMLYIRVKRSPFPHAKVKSIDTSKAEKLPGVHAVMTYKDIPDKMLAGTKPILASEPALVGDPVVAVAAENETIAENALLLVDVQYDQLPFVLDPREAAKAGAAKAISSLDSNVAGPNFKVTRGDIGKGFGDADLTVSHSADTQDQQHVALEPHVAVARWDGDRLTVWLSSQYTHSAANFLSSTLGMPTSKVRVIAEFTGGGFGDKGGAAFPYAPLVALMARKLGRPVRYELTRADVFVEASHHFQVFQDMKIGFKKDGTMTALQANAVTRLGAYSRGSGNASDSLSAARVQYNVPNVQLDGMGVITNSGSSGPRRSVGEASGVFVLETLMDEAAEKLSMDPVELRLKNINEKADPESKLPYSSNGMRDCIVKGAEAFGWKTRWKGWDAWKSQSGPLRKGVGFMALASNKGSKSPPMTAVVEIPVDGSVRVVQGAAHIGGPQRTTFAIMVAEALGADINQISVSDPDTAFTSDTGVVAGSRATKSVGLALKAAAEDARRQLLGFAASKFTRDLKKDVKIEDLDIANGLISIKGDAATKPITFRDAVASGFIVIDEQVIPVAATIIGRGVIPPETKYAQQTYAAGFYEVEVNVETGVVRVTDALQTHDVGKVINLTGLRNCVDGGIVQGMGFALTEDFVYDASTGIPVASNLDDYKLLMINNVPKTTHIYIESNDAIGPYGAKGVGEPALMAAAPAIANAIYNAAGIRLKSLPMNPKKVMEALKKRA